MQGVRPCPLLGGHARVVIDQAEHRELHRPQLEGPADLGRENPAGDDGRLCQLIAQDGAQADLKLATNTADLGTGFTAAERGLVSNAVLAKVNATNAIDTESAMSFMTPPRSSDLLSLKMRGAKAMVYHGTADPIFSSDDTSQWYEALGGANGGDASNFARLFRVPGMNHCSGGPTVDQFDMLAPLVAWVELGQAPASVIASARGAGNAGGVNADVPAGWSASRSRPLCPDPQVARYKGSGDVESSASFSCS